MSAHSPAERPRIVTQERRQTASPDPSLLFARLVAEMLGEETLPVFSQIYRIVKVLGQDRVTGLLRQVLEIENNGGKMILRGTRRRTVGGVFFRLAKDQYGELLPFLFHQKRPAPAAISTVQSTLSDPGEQCPEIQ